jgi:hypothetical protein
MPTTFFSRRGGDAGAPSRAANVRVGQLYFDAQRRQVHFLNETARQLRREGLPVHPEDLQRQPLQTLAGGPVHAEDLPLFRAWREATPHEATFVLARPGCVQHVTWSAAPLTGQGGQVQGVTASVCVTAPEPDWLQLGGLAHDLRTPLQALRLLVPVLEGAPLSDPDAAQVLERLRSAADRALSVSLDLLEWCRVPALGGRRVECSWALLAPLLASLAAEQQPLALRKHIALRLDLADALGLEVYTDRTRLSRLLANLLSNAVRYTATGEVRFTASWRLDGGGTRQALALSVADTAGGILPEEQESIFQAFERGRSGREGDSGSGLGLAVVDQLVNELGLLLEVTSEYGHGSTFELLLPPVILRLVPGG